MNGKSVVVCTETLVSPQLSVQAPTTLCARLERIVIEYLSIMKVVLKNYLCIYVSLIISKFTIFFDLSNAINHENYLIDS